MKDLRPERKRIEFIDVARGIFIMFMLFTHAFTVSNPPRESLMWHLALMMGVVTECFIMLSGFSMAVNFTDSGRDFKKVRRRLVRRGIEIGIIAYISNVVFKSMQLFMTGTLSTNVFVSILTCRYPWNISFMLIPISINMLMSPILINLSFKISPVKLLTFVTFLDVCTRITWGVLLAGDDKISIYQVYSLIKDRMDFVVILELCILGVWSFCIGLLFKNGTLKEGSWLVIMPLASMMLGIYYLVPGIRVVTPAILINIGAFFFMLGCAMILANLKSLKVGKVILALWGRSSLLVFILHRPIIQLIKISVEDGKRGNALGFMMMIIASLLCTAVCLIKENNPAIRSRLKQIGF